ncbi:MAG: hypothetical protein K2G30_06460 [Muribaculaceae bacterium]|nr:hypothetical protein [Muribaculaceae bacterium]
MKTLRKIAGLLIVMVMMAVSTSSCSDDDDDKTPSDTLVGTWVEKSSTMPFTLVLKSDHTGTISYDTSSRALLTDHFNWSTNDSGSECYLNIIHTSGDVIFENVVNPYVLAGNELIVIMSLDGYSYQANFTRK